jgi:hypothetical protein
LHIDENLRWRFFRDDACESAYHRPIISALKAGCSFSAFRSGRARRFRTVQAGDTIDLKAIVPVGDPAIDPRQLSIAAQNVKGKVYVPVVEFMQLFGKPFSVE